MKTILITGGTGDLGRTVVPRLARHYRCAVLYRKREDFDRLRESAGHLTGIEADLRDETSVSAAVERAGSLFALVHLAGGFEMGSVESTSIENWNRMLALNTTGAFVIARAAIPKIERGGRIVAISSAVSAKPAKGMAAYVVSKAALNSLISVLALELNDRGITANAILPRSLETPELREKAAETILFLLSDAAAGITGSQIVMA